MAHPLYLELLLDKSTMETRSKRHQNIGNSEPTVLTNKRKRNEMNSPLKTMNKSGKKKSNVGSMKKNDEKTTKTGKNLKKVWNNMLQHVMTVFCNNVYIMFE